MSTPDQPLPRPADSRRRPLRPEVLAPAGDLDALRAALGAGADAVYFGLDEGFNARARAQNFTLEGLPAIVAEVHRAGARAYVTLNTLVFEVELPRVAEIVAGVAAAGVDALIIQDPAVALIAREICPELELHASTQMTISSPDGAAFARSLGISRVVVPRELSVGEIRQFAAETDVELEVFIHGALCVSYSGQCLTSEAWGGRSANRGQCAQSCRMPYDLVVDAKVRDLGEVKYLLSPKDLSGFRAVSDLCDIGVHGLKIEGRLKSPAYVMSTVESYRRWLDAVERGVTGADEAQLAEDMASLTVAYSRGFGDGFLGGSDHQTLVEGRFPKHRGALLGRVLFVRGSIVRIGPAERVTTGGAALPGKLHTPEGSMSSPLPALGGQPDAATGPGAAPAVPRAGQGVVFDAGRSEDQDEPGGPLFGAFTISTGVWELAFGQPGPDLNRVRPGQLVWLTSDPALKRRAEKLVRALPPDGRVPVDLRAEGVVGAPLRVVATARWAQASVSSEVALTAAQGQSTLDDTLLRGKLATFGGTPFHLGALDTSGLETGLHLPVSALKALRRELVAALLPQIEHVPPRTVAPQAWRSLLGSIDPVPPGTPSPPALVALCRTEEQLEAAITAGLPEVELDFMELVGLSRAVIRARQAGLRVTLATVRIQKPGEEGYDRRLARLEPDGVLVRHWGGLMAFARGVLQGPGARRPTLHGDFSLNVTNQITFKRLVELGLETVTVAHDLDAAQLRALLEVVPARQTAVTVHHHLPTFHTEHCVYSHLLSHGRDFKTCGRPCEAHRVSLRDHTGREHPVIVDVACRNTVFNAEAQSAASLAATLIASGVARFRVELVREDRAQTEAVLGAWLDLLNGRTTPRELLRRTGVHEQFGVTAGTMRVLSV